MTHYRSILAAAALAIPAPAQHVELDAYAGTRSSFPFDLVATDRGAYFATRGPTSGPDRLYRFRDGVFAEVDINLNQGGCSPSGLIMLGEDLYLSADDRTKGQELWRVSPGAVPVPIDVVPGSVGCSPLHLTEFRGKVFFSAYVRSVGGRQLWSYDPVSGGVAQETFLTNGTVEPAQLTVVGDNLFFTANAASTGRELWLHDGNSVRLVKDIRPNGGSSPDRLAAVGGLLYFRANDGSNGTEPWVSDGTAAGTFMLRNVHSSLGSNPDEFVGVAGGLCLFAAGSGGGQTGRELWQSDGTVAGTRLHSDINVGRNSSDPSSLTVAGDTLFFRARPNSRTGNVLHYWRAGMGRPLPVRHGAGAHLGMPVGAAMTAISAGLVVVTGDDGSAVGQEPYLASPTGFTALTNVSAMGSSTPEEYVVTTGRVYFVADDQGAFGREVYYSGLTAAGFAATQTFGQGCAGTRGVPSYAATGRPVLGATNFGLSADNLLPRGSLVLEFARSRRRIPIAGCEYLLRTTLFSAGAIASPAGDLNLRIPLPVNPSMRGVEIHTQLFGADPQGTAFGAFSFSNGVYLLLGS